MPPKISQQALDEIACQDEAKGKVKPVPEGYDGNQPDDGDKSEEEEEPEIEYGPDSPRPARRYYSDAEHKHGTVIIDNHAFRTPDSPPPAFVIIGNHTFHAQPPPSLHQRLQQLYPADNRKTFGDPRNATAVHLQEILDLAQEHVDQLNTGGDREKARIGNAIKEIRWELHLFGGHGQVEITNSSARRLIRQMSTWFEGGTFKAHPLTKKALVKRGL